MGLEKVMSRVAKAKMAAAREKVLANATVAFKKVTKLRAVGHPKAVVKVKERVVCIMLWVLART